MDSLIMSWHPCAERLLLTTRTKHAKQLLLSRLTSWTKKSKTFSQVSFRHACQSFRNDPPKQNRLISKHISEIINDYSLLPDRTQPQEGRSSLSIRIHSRTAVETGDQVRIGPGHSNHRLATFVRDYFDSPLQPGLARKQKILFRTSEPGRFTCCKNDQCFHLKARV